ncbi:MAG: T9SS type A sorting domain-containing protein [Paraprevotella sp.]|nr:T9SS type A sorting domain-containing protein [Paraprevotella sp.]
MRYFTFQMKAVYVALVAILLGVQNLSAQDFPSVDQLYGRYTFHGECAYDDMSGGESDEIPVPATTDYNMAVLPGDNAGEVKVLGFFGYGGGVTLNYNQEDGTLTGNVSTVVFCMTNSLMAVADGSASDGVDFSFKVSEQDGNIVLTAQNALTDVTLMDYNTGAMGMLSYSAGYTLTQNNETYPLSDVAGVYDFVSNTVDNNTLVDATENFKLTVADATTEGGEPTVTLDGWFGIENTSVTASHYYEKGGILVLPHDTLLANGLCFGAQPEEAGGYNPNEAPYFFVEKDKLVSPGYIVLDNGFDEVMEMSVQMAVVGGQAVKNGSHVNSVLTSGVAVTPGFGTISVVAAASTKIQVYDVQGAEVAATQGTTAEFNGLQAGLYLVKVGGKAVKVLVK